MAEKTRILARIESVADRNGRYSPDAYFFVLEALEGAVADLPRRRHLSGPELLDGVRDLGRDRFGPMAPDVFASWGVRATVDFGHIVFHLVADGLLRKTPDDCLADFEDRFDFDEEFAENYFHDKA